MMLQRIVFRYSLTLCLLAQSLMGVAFAAEEDMQTLVKQTLMKRLQKGGYTVFMRHGDTDTSSYDRYQFVMDDCEQQQKLSAMTKDYLSTAKKAITDLNISFTPVLVSPYCRAKENAYLLVGKAYNVAPQLQVSLMGDRATRAQSASFLLNKLNVIPSDQNNTLTISHLSNLLQTFPDQTAEPGDMLIFRPMPDKASPKYLGVIPLQDWKILAPKIASNGGPHEN